MEIRISPDLRIVANKLSGLATSLLTPIINDAANFAGPEIERAFKDAVPVKTSASRDSIQVSVSTGRGRGARLTVTGKNTLHYVLEGTKPHIITATRGKMLAFTTDDGTLHFAKSVAHPGSQPNDFVTRAWNIAQPPISQQVRAAGLRAWRELTRGLGR